MGTCVTFWSCHQWTNWAVTRRIETVEVLSTVPPMPKDDVRRMAATGLRVYQERTCVRCGFTQVSCEDS